MKLGKIGILIIVCSLFVALSSSVYAADETKTIDDSEDDVMDYEGETTTTKPNIDIKKVTYSKEGKKVTLTLQVKGIIENRGDLESLTEMFSFVSYMIVLSTSDYAYGLNYMNNTCTIMTDEGEENITDFSVDHSTLTASFDLNDENETYDFIYVYAMDVDLLANEEYIDEANDVPLEVETGGPYEGYIGEDIDFMGGATGGSPPYNWDWDFGDGNHFSGQSSSLEFIEATHTYTAARIYTVTLTVIDADGTTKNATTTATITESGETNGGTDGGTIDSNILLFGAVIVIIAIIGVIAVVVILRR